MRLLGRLLLLVAGGLALGAAPAPHPAPPPAPPVARPVLILLGTGGGPLIRSRRAQSASLLVVGRRTYLVDAGAGTIGQLGRAGFRPVDLTAVFLTHHHLDHNADVVSLIGFGWVEGRRRALTIIGPVGTRALVTAALDYFSVSERVFAAESHSKARAADQAEAQEIEAPGLVYDDGVVRVTAAENSHYATFDPGRDRSYAYRMDAPGRTVVFTGDTGPSEAVRELARGADVLVSEVIDPDAALVAAARNAGVAPDPTSPRAAHLRQEHLTPDEVGRLAQAAHVKMVVLTHVSPGLDEEGDSSRYLSGVKRQFSGPVVLGRDLDRF